MFSHALPLLACPWCGFRIPLAIWRSLGINIDTQKAASLLASVCMECGTENSAFVEETAIVMATDDRQHLALELFTDHRAALHIWRSYHDAAVGPREVLDKLLHLLPDKGGGVNGKVALALQMFRLIVDAERRMGLQLALLEVCPEISCLGCQCNICLRCHCMAHTGVCLPPSRRMDSACPSCGAGANAAASHKMMLCVCGKYWEHDEPAPDMLSGEAESLFAQAHGDNVLKGECGINFAHART
jgi:hypothetical protein